MKNLFNNKMFYSFSALFANYFPNFAPPKEKA